MDNISKDGFRKCTDSVDQGIYLPPTVRLTEYGVEKAGRFTPVRFIQKQALEGGGSKWTQTSGLMLVSGLTRTFFFDGRRLVVVKQ